MTPATRALVVEDDPQMARFLRATLTAHELVVTVAGTIALGRTAAAADPPDIVLLDLGLPDGDGLELVRALRTWTAVPIIVLSARGREDDKVAALDAGADDYLTKPFGVRELFARIRVALRHRPGAAAATAVLTAGPITLDAKGGTIAVRVEGIGDLPDGVTWLLDHLLTIAAHMPA